MSLAEHWEQVYATRAAHDVGWYQARPDTSLRLISSFDIQLSDRIIDVGGGASNLVDHLLADGFRDLTVLDISATAIAAVKTRLGAQADRVSWIAGDVTTLALPGDYRLWHDRAVFHFLTEPLQRQAYISKLKASVPVGGYVIMATFADDGPSQCSKLPVCRYVPESLTATLGTGFELLEWLRETHTTPAQGKQNFIYCCFRRT